MPTPGRIPIAMLKPVAAGTVVWRHGGALQVTVVVKATFALVHDGDARLVAPAPIVANDQYHQSGAGSLAATHDLAPLMPNAGVVLVGSARSQQPVAAMAIRLAVYRERPLVEKALHVFGDRAPGAPTPQPFVAMPIVYERAFGGPAFRDNPVGTGAAPDARARPNFEYPNDPRRPAGLGPVSGGWGPRRLLLGAHKPLTLDEPGSEVPNGFDFRWFNTAPADQQCDFFRGDEWIVLDGMHATQPRLQTRLPTVTAKAIWTAPIGGRPPEGRPVSLSADTLLIDAERQLCSLVWRGRFVLTQADALPHVRLFTGVETPGHPIAWPDEAHQAPPRSVPKVRSFVQEDDEDDYVPTRAIVLPQLKAPVLPFAKTGLGAVPQPEVRAVDSDPDPLSWMHLGDTAPATKSPITEALPFARAPRTAPVPLPGAPWSGIAAQPVDQGDPDTMTVAIKPSKRPMEPQAAPLAVAPPPVVPMDTPMVAPPSSVASPPAMVSPPPMLAPPMVAPPATAPPTFADVEERGAEVPRAATAASSQSETPLSVKPRRAGTREREKVIAALGAGQPLEGIDLTDADLHELDLHGQAMPGAKLKGADLRRADLTGATLAGAVLINADLSEAKLDRADLSGADLAGTTLAGASFKGANLSGAKLDGARGEGAVFDDAAMTKTSAQSARLARASFKKASAEGSIWEKATLDEASFEGATLKGANLQRVSCNKAGFAGAALDGAEMMRLTGEGADLSRATLDGANLRKAELCGASFDGAVMRKVSAEKADLSRASLRFAKLEGALLRGAVLEGAILANAIVDGADLRDADLQQANVFGVALSRANTNGANTKNMSDADPDRAAR